jgi:dsRNA-specific ribonuclease
MDPVTLLVQWHQKEGFKPNFTFDSTKEGLWSCTVRSTDQVFTGEGNTKGVAKAHAARHTLDFLVRHTNKNRTTPKESTSARRAGPSTPSASASASAMEPVSRLMEWHQRERLNPNFTFDSTKEGLWSCTVRSMPQVFTGEGPTKKVAKARAAQHALEFLDDQKDTSAGRAWPNTLSVARPSTPSAVYSAMNPVSLLVQWHQTEGLEHNFTFDFTKDGLWSCTVRSTPQVFTGEGPTKGVAKAHAAQQALEFLDDQKEYTHNKTVVFANTNSERDAWFEYKRLQCLSQLDRIRPTTSELVT